MKFFSIASIISFAALVIASPTVELIKERQSNTAAAADACKQKQGTLLCCSAQAKLAGLLGIVPQLTCIGIIVNPEVLCGSSTSCCNSNPVAVTNTAVLNILPNAQVCPAIAL